MYQSTQSFNASPGNPQALNFWKLACSNSPRGKKAQKSRSNAPPISTEIPLLKDKFLLQSNTVHVFQREICRNDTFKLLLKTLLKEFLANKGEILTCKSVKPCKNRKNARVYYTITRENPVQIPHPSKATLKFPPPRARYTVKCPRYALRGGCWSFDLTGT